MADVTIGQLNTALPNKNSAIIPFSDGSTTYKTSPSGIVAASPGSVIQVGFFTYGTDRTITDNTQYTNFFSVNFTPRFSTSKIFIQSIFYVAGTGGIRIRRNNTSIFEPLANGSAPFQFFTNTGGPLPSNSTMRNGYPINWYDSPQTTSQITYNFDVRTYNVGMQFNENNYSAVGAPSNVTLMEIAG